MTKSRLRIGYLQHEAEFGDVAANLEQVAGILKEAPAFDVLVLPELFSTGYLFRDAEELRAYAEDESGPTRKALADWSRENDAWIVGGFAELDGERIYNSAALSGPDGSMQVYRKVHLFDREKEMFEPGDRQFRAWTIETPAGSVRVGIMICFDWVFPESARSLALDGADVILHPSNLVLSYCQDAMKTRCLENHVFAVTANRTGSDDRGDIRLDFTGASQIVDPHGRVLDRAQVNGSCVGIADVDLELARDKQLTERNGVLRDRRPECYRTVSEG